LLNRAGDFHRTRLIKGWRSATGIASGLVISAFFATCTENSELLSARPTYAETAARREAKKVNLLRPFPMCTSFSCSEYYDRTDAYNGHWGMLSLSFRCKPPTFTKTESARKAGWRLSGITGNPRRRNSGFRMENE
jgi:hypothetical protein